MAIILLDKFLILREIGFVILLFYVTPFAIHFLFKNGSRKLPPEPSSECGCDPLGVQCSRHGVCGLRANIIGQIILSRRVFVTHGSESNEFKDMVVELMTSTELNIEEAFGLALQKAVPISVFVTPRLEASAYA